MRDVVDERRIPLEVGGCGVVEWHDLRCGQMVRDGEYLGWEGQNVALGPAD